VVYQLKLGDISSFVHNNLSRLNLERRISNHLKYSSIINLQWVGMRLYLVRLYFGGIIDGIFHDIQYKLKDLNIWLR
jgi:hypothetical protein